MVLRRHGPQRVVNAVVRIRIPDLIRSEYGWLVIGKVVALCLLGVLGWRQRRSGVAALRADPTARGPLIRLAATEAVIFGITFGIAVGLGRTPPPPPPLLNPSASQVEIGYDFAGPPTLARVLLDWRFDLIFGTAALVFAAVYLAGVVGCAAAVTRGRSAGSSRGCGVCGAAVRDILRRGPLHAGDVQHAHGRAHAAVDAGADPPRARGAR